MPRRLLALALLVACAGCSRATPPPALVGAWRSEVTITNGAFAAIHDLRFLSVFNAGGTMTESSNYDGLPPVPPAYGEWRATGPRTFEARYTFFTVNPPAGVDTLAKGGGWTPAGSGVLTERYTLAADGQSYDSRLTLELFDPAGKPAPGGGAGTAHGVRAAWPR